MNVKFAIKLFFSVSFLLLSVISCQLSVKTVFAASPGLRINEIMYSPPEQSGGGEWVELYNYGNEAVQIVGGIGKGSWVFVDYSGSHFLAKEALFGSLTVKPGEFLILANDAENFLKTHSSFSGNLVDTTMSLPNDFGFIQLKDGQGNVVSQAFWSQNLGADRNNKTLEFTKDIFREGLRDFGTPGQENSVENVILPPAPSPIPPSPSPSPKLLPSPQAKPKTGKVIINEILYNPGKNSQPWIELKNQEAKTLDLTGWKIVQLQDKKDVFLGGVILANSYRIFNPADLNKNSETLQVFDGEGKKIFEVRYSSPIPTDWSAARFEDSVWKITSLPTPEKDNIYFISQEIKESFVPKELIPGISFENASATNPVDQKPLDKNGLILKGSVVSLLLATSFVLVKKKLTL